MSSCWLELSGVGVGVFQAEKSRSLGCRWVGIPENRQKPFLRSGVWTEPVRPSLPPGRPIVTQHLPPGCSEELRPLEYHRNSMLLPLLKILK